MRPVAAAFAPVLLAVSSIAAAAAVPPSAAPPDLTSILRDYDRYLAIADPVSAGQRGDLDALGRWPDDSPAGITARREALATLKAAIAALPTAGLGEEDGLNRDLLRDRVELDLAGFAFDEERIPFNTGDGFFTVPDYAAQGIALRSEAQARAWIAKVAALPAYYATQIANMRRGIKSGFVRPRIVVEKVTRTLRRRAAQPAEASALLMPFATLPSSMPAPTRAALAAQALEVVRSRVKPAEAALAEFFEREYLPHAAAAIGIGGLKGWQGLL